MPVCFQNIASALRFHQQKKSGESARGSSRPLKPCSARGPGGAYREVTTLRPIEAHRGACKSRTASFRILLTRCSSRSHIAMSCCNCSESARSNRTSHPRFVAVRIPHTTDPLSQCFEQLNQKGVIARAAGVGLCRTDQSLLVVDKEFHVFRGWMQHGGDSRFGPSHIAKRGNNASSIAAGSCSAIASRSCSLFASSRARLNI